MKPAWPTLALILLCLILGGVAGAWLRGGTPPSDPLPPTLPPNVVKVETVPTLPSKPGTKVVERVKIVTEWKQSPPEVVERIVEKKVADPLWLPDFRAIVKLDKFAAKEGEGWRAEAECQIGWGDGTYSSVAWDAKEIKGEAKAVPPLPPEKWLAQAGAGLGQDGWVATASVNRRLAGRVWVGAQSIVGPGNAAIMATVGVSW